jgi:hypothetical protein
MLFYHLFLAESFSTRIQYVLHVFHSTYVSSPALSAIFRYPTKHHVTRLYLFKLPFYLQSNFHSPHSLVYCSSSQLISLINVSGKSVFDQALPKQQYNIYERMGNIST